MTPTPRPTPLDQTKAEEAHDHDHPHDHVHGHDHPHGSGHGHGNPDDPRDHAHEGGWWAALTHQLTPHSHDHHDSALDPALATDRGIWALKVSLAGLLVTAVFQIVIVAISGSVALLADTIHNFSDAFTAVPLWLAFALARRAGNRRYTYGYGRAEDLAGAFIVLMIFASALVVFYESIQKILNPQPLTNLGWVAAAAIIGFLGNELVAWYRIRVGRQIGSAALIADGLHARTDGFTSLGVLAGAVGVWLGFPLADPLIGLVIGITILVIVAGTARQMWRRLMDAVEPETIERLEVVTQGVSGVIDVHDVRVRWLGHTQQAELHITVNCQLPTVQSHRIAEEVRHALFHALPSLAEATVHVDPCECEPTVEYHFAAHHRFEPARTVDTLRAASSSG
ncbi:MAG: cation transporter [Anaerolineales bacterium]|nr:cation transporter [Anaerolineales bacterium]